MSTEPSSGAASGAQGRVKLPLPMLLVVVMLGVWLGLGGGYAGLYFLAKSGKLPLPQLGAAEAAAATTTHTVALEPILVNLADEGGHAYLRLGLTLEMSGTGEGKPAAEPAKPAEGSKEPEAPKEAEAPKAAEGAKPSGGDASATAMRDIVLTVLGRQTSSSLLGPDGKEHLKIELRDAISKSNLKVDVKDVYFSDFLVQV